MTSIVSYTFLLGTLAIAPFFLFMAAITAAAILGKRRKALASGITTATGRKFLVVIPAHDEEGVIASTVASCRALLYDQSLFDVAVIADNCSDLTASLAREAGANVVERDDPTLRSKGHALEYFFTQIAWARPDSTAYDAFVLVDADTVVAPDLLVAFDRSIARGSDWMQGYYTVRNPDASWRTRMMTFAFSLANGVWMAGLDGLGLGVGLKGNGMCFTREGLRRVPWKAYGLVEDMEFAWTLRVLGERVRFVPDARVFGEMVSKGGAGAASQRRRWEMGRKGLRPKFALPLLHSPSLDGLAKVLYLLDLYYPPISQIVFALFATALVHPFAQMNPELRWASMVLIGPHLVFYLILLIYFFAPTVTLGLPTRYLFSLAAAPYYVVWKLVVAAGHKPKGGSGRRENPNRGLEVGEADSPVTSDLLSGLSRNAFTIGIGARTMGECLAMPDLRLRGRDLPLGHWYGNFPRNYGRVSDCSNIGLEGCLSKKSNAKKQAMPSITTSGSPVD